MFVCFLKYQSSFSCTCCWNSGLGGSTCCSTSNQQVSSEDSDWPDSSYVVYLHVTLNLHRPERWVLVQSRRGKTNRAKEEFVNRRQTNQIPVIHCCSSTREAALQQTDTTLWKWLEMHTVFLRFPLLRHAPDQCLLHTGIISPTWRPAFDFAHTH